MCDTIVFGTEFVVKKINKLHGNEPICWKLSDGIRRFFNFYKGLKSVFVAINQANMSMNAVALHYCV